MFLFGVVVGAGLIVGVLWLLRLGGGQSVTAELTIRQARHQIHEVERAAIRRMLDEAEAERRHR